MMKKNGTPVRRRGIDVSLFSREKKERRRNCLRDEGIIKKHFSLCLNKNQNTHEKQSSLAESQQTKNQLTPLHITKEKIFLHPHQKMVFPMQQKQKFITPLQIESIKVIQSQKYIRHQQKQLSTKTSSLSSSTNEKHSPCGQKIDTQGHRKSFSHNCYSIYDPIQPNTATIRIAHKFLNTNPQISKQSLESIEEEPNSPCFFRISHIQNSKESLISS